MPSNFIENPETGKLYLIKRNKSGTAAKRAQPGTIVKFNHVDGMRSPTVNVHWQYDGVIEEGVLMYYGLVKELTRKWVDMEQKRLKAELDETRKALTQIEGLMFIPEQMAKVTA